jgi:signal transduction histidine kinase
MKADEYRGPAHEKSITLNVQHDKASEKIYADEQALMQVLDNLISNAVKYSPHHKNIWISSLALGEVVQIRIKDEGQGMTEEDLKRLFGKFAKLSARPTGNEHSTGLGLSIVKRLVESMNGKIWCESEYGKGATFVLEMPRVM